MKVRVRLAYMNYKPKTATAMSVAEDMGSAYLNCGVNVGYTFLRGKYAHYKHCITLQLLIFVFSLTWGGQDI